MSQSPKAIFHSASRFARRAKIKAKAPNRERRSRSGSCNATCFLLSSPLSHPNIHFNITELVLLRLKILGVWAAQDADHSGTGLRAADDVVAEDHAMMMPQDDDARRRSLTGLGAIIEDSVPLKEVVVGAHRLALGAEEDAGAAVAGDAIIAEAVVRILMADRDAGS
jgi:hypothetical protein